MSRIVCIGEPMVELRKTATGWDVGYGGDTLNVALHLTRLGHPTDYLTALGRDPFAQEMCAAWAREGLGLSMVLSHRERATGLYAIETDIRGERHFSYWRGESAARELFECEGIEDALEEASHARLLFFSLISLAILPEEGRERILGLAGLVRMQGGKVAFDANYRESLWRDRTDARYWHDRAVALADFGLPTREDQAPLDIGDTPQEVAAHWRALGCGEVVVKLGAKGCLLPSGEILPPEPVRPIDTSGAGDAFDAGYLGARLSGAEPADAACHGHALAGWTIQRAGAIPPRDAEAPYR